MNTVNTTTMIIMMMKMMMTICTHPHSKEDSYHNPNLIINMYGNTITGMMMMMKTMSNP